MATTQHNVHAYRETLIGNAIRARKIAADRADDYRRLYDADPVTITRLLTAPVEQGGLMAGIAFDRSGQPAPPPEDEYPAEWLPETRGKALHGQVAFEDATTAVESASLTPPAGRSGSDLRSQQVAAAGAVPVQPGTAGGSITVGND